MCGIAGYTGYQDAYPILLHALQRVEYRGYDSWGVAVQTAQRLRVLKKLGPVEQLSKSAQPLRGQQGIGHTRWATVGAPSLENAHPHLDCTGKVAIVHNGEIFNYPHLKDRLLEHGHQFQSETDSEVLAHLIESYAAQEPVQRVARALGEVDGSYALAVLDQESDLLVVARRESPLVLGLGKNENFVASDVSALLEYTQQAVYLEDGDIGTLDPQGFQVWHGELSTTRRVYQIPWSPRDLDKAGYDHFFLKEIHEQPRIIRDTLAGRVSITEPGVTLGVDLKSRGAPKRILLAGAGSAYNACLIGEGFLSNLAGCSVTARVASELGHPGPAGAGYWALFLSQSGETADTISAARQARQAGSFTLALTSSQGSSLSRVVDETLYMRTGLEVSVAATKTFMAQIVELYLLGLHLLPMPVDTLHTLLTELRLLPVKVQRILAAEAQVQAVAQRIAHSRDLFLIAKGTNYPVALEGAWKLKEVAYVHAEAFPAGELKHGPFALLDEETPVIAIMPKDDAYQRLLGTVKEVKARGAPVIAITDADDGEAAQLVDEVIHVPTTDPCFSPVLNIVPLQLLAYYMARECGYPIDKPRNLAKSVTVH